MFIKSLITASALLLALQPSSSFACVPVSRGEDGPPITFGGDAPSDPATLGYFSNHFSLNVRNLTASLEFYTQVIGYRHIFTVQPSEHLYIAYLSHSQGGRNGTGYQTTAELNRDKNNNAGLIEMLFLDVPSRADLPSSSQQSNTFGHIGLVVPDVAATQARLDALPGVEMLKRTGDPTPAQGKIANANGFPEAAWAEISAEERALIEGTLSAINERFIYIADPDGNIIEIQPQD